MTDSDKKPHYLGHRERLREKLIKDPRSPADYEILELLLGYALIRRDTKPLAKELLARFGSLKGVFYAGGENMRDIDGLGEGVENLFRVLREFQARVQEAPVHERQVFSDPDVVAAMAKARIGHAETEEFWMALVDNKNRLLAWERVSEGTVDRTHVYPREILTQAMRHKAGGVILVHNHPGGDPRPSSQDIELTRRLKSVARELGLRILDHIIVSEGDYFSFHMSGML